MLRSWPLGAPARGYRSRSTATPARSISIRSPEASSQWPKPLGTSPARERLNFGNPRDPEIYWQFEGCVRGIAEACEVLGTPVVSGNVSFYNESDDGAVLPTPLIGMLGILEEAEQRIGMAPPADAQLGLIWIDLPDVPAGGLGASELLSRVHGFEDGLPVPPDLPGERALCRLLVDLVAQGRVQAAHDSAEGGRAVTLAEMAIVARTGLVATLPAELGCGRTDALLFGERPGEVVVAYRESDLARIEAMTREAGLRFAPIGRTTTDGFIVIEPGVRIALGEATSVYENAIPSAMG